MKTLNVLIQNSKGRSLAALQISFAYGMDLLVDTIETLTLKGYEFDISTREALLEWLDYTISSLEDGDTQEDTHKLSIDEDTGRIITLSIAY